MSLLFQSSATKVAHDSRDRLARLFSFTGMALITAMELFSNSFRFAVSPSFP